MWSVQLALVLIAAGAAPLALLITRGAIRKQRAAIIDDLSTLFDDTKRKSYPQLDVVRTKYMPTGGEGGAGVRQSRTALYLTAAIFWLLSAAGFSLLIVPIVSLFGQHTTQTIAPVLLWTDKMGAEPEVLVRACAVTGFAFLGAYVSMIQYLQKAMLNYELDSLSFTRAIIVLLLGSTVATVVYRALVAVPLVGGEHAEVASTAWWVGFAFIAGMAHESALAYFMRHMDLRFRKAKAELTGAEIVPVEVIEGIDTDIAFRLQESNIYDIQNLATHNPIQLYVETPYGLLQAFDWVLQAQLCVAAGREAFVELHKHGMRTIFDLERAVLSAGAPDDYVRAIGMVLFARASADFKARLGLLEGQAPNVEAIRHAVAVLADDLHVHRLRRVWAQLRERVSDHRDWLFRVGPLPGEDGYSPRPKVVVDNDAEERGEPATA